MPTGSTPDTIDENKFTDGRAMGRTHYFATSSTATQVWMPTNLPDHAASTVSASSFQTVDNVILYPSNHYSKAKTSKEGLFKVIYGGLKGNSKFTGSRTEYYDPSGLDTSPKQAVTTISVEGSNTSTGIIAVNRGGVRNNNESGSIGRK